MQTRINETKHRAYYSFDSLHELGNFIAATPRIWPYSFSQDNDHAASQSWDLNAGYAASVEMARNGWNEGAARVQQALKAFAPATPQPDTRTDFYGFRPHVPRFCAGAPDSMIRHCERADTGCGKVLTLAVGLDANAFARAVCMANFGVAVAQYVNQLETDGTRVEVIGVLTGTFISGWHMAHSFTAKRADQPLDLAVLAFAIGHPAMLRRLGFALLERAPTKAADPSYGAAVDVVLSDLINPPPGIVILNGMKDANTHAPTPQAALEYVTKQIDKAIQQQEL